MSKRPAGSLPLALINKYLINPLIRRFAGRSRSVFVMVRHVGRKSGKMYETPIIAIPVESGFVVALTFGRQADWFRNVEAAGGCTLIWQGRDYVIREIQTLSVVQARPLFPLPLRLILYIRSTQDFVRLGYKPMGQA